MNTYLRYGLCAAMVALFGGLASAGETFYVVRVSDMMREQAYQVMGGDEFKQFQKQIALEERNFPKALTMVGDEWRKDEANKTVPFPGGRLSPRKIVGQPEPFDTRDKADKRVDQIQKREDDKRLRDKTPKPPADKVKDAREADKVLQARRAADLIAAKLTELAGGDAKTGDKPAADKPAADKPAAPAAAQPAADKKAAGAALNKAL